MAKDCGYKHAVMGCVLLYRMVKLIWQYITNTEYDIMLNYLSTGTTLPFALQ
jgi:hypothetical protein